MDAIPVANPSPTRRLHGTRAALITLAIASAVTSIVVLTVAFSLPESSPPPSILRLEDADSLPVGEPQLNTEGRFWIVKLESGEFIALSRKSTHLGCSVPWRPEFSFMGREGWFRDPCSGSTWDVDGTRMFGPAPRDLDRFPVMVEGEDVLVNTRHSVCSDGGSLSARGQCRAAPPFGWPDPFQ